MMHNNAHKICPECGHVFQGNGWDGIDAHWKSKHEKLMPYAKAWPLIQEGTYATESQTGRHARDTARYEALAREHGADLSEDQFKKALGRVARHKLVPGPPLASKPKKAS